MWSELYINDPDILSDVTEIAVKKLGYWIERRLREGRSSPPPRTFYLYRVLLNMWDTFRESTFHESQLLLSPLLTIPRGRANLDPTDEKQESIRIRSIRKKKGKISRDLRRKRHHRRRFQCFRIVFHARFFTFLVSPVQPRLLFPRITR